MSQPIMSHLQQGLAWYKTLAPIWVACIEAGFALVVTMLLSFVAYVLYKILAPRLAKTKQYWDDAFICALHMPLQMIVWLVGLANVVGAANIFFPKVDFSSILSPFRQAVVVVMLFVFVLRFIRLYETKIVTATKNGNRKKRKLDPGAMASVGKFMRVIIAMFGVLMVLQIVGVPITTLIAFGGASTLVVGLAAKDLLANFFGGLTVYTDRPFVEGDWISSPEKDIEGTVEKIGWRVTKVRRFNKRALYVPNYLFSTITVENPSRMLNRQIKCTIGVRYADVGVVKNIVDDVKAMLLSHPDIDINQTCYVHVIEYGDSSINFQIYTFTKTTNWLEFMAIQEEVLLKVADVIAKHGAEFAFPTRTLEMPAGLNLKTE